MILARSRLWANEEEEGDRPGVSGGVLEAAPMLKLSFSRSVEENEVEESASANGGKRDEKLSPS